MPLHILRGGLPCPHVIYTGAGDLNGPHAFMAISLLSHLLRLQETFSSFLFLIVYVNFKRNLFSIPLWYLL